MVQTGMWNMTICKSVKLLWQSVEAVSCRPKIQPELNCRRSGKSNLGKVNVYHAPMLAEGPMP